MFRRHFCTLILAALLAAAASAQNNNDPLILKLKGGDRHTLSLANLAAAGEAGTLFRQTLQRDLERSGWFKIVPSGASVSIEGTASGSGSIAAAVTVTWPGKRFTWNQNASQSDARFLAHALADDMVKHIAGAPGMATATLALVRRTAPNAADLYVCDSDGANLRRITNDNASIVGLRWSPDQQNLYFTSYRTDYGIIHRANLATGKVSPLANFKGFNAGAAVNPADPDKIALILSHQGNPELYILDSRNGGLTRLTNTKNGSEASPCWSPDGSKIVYTSDLGTRTPQLYIVDIATRQSRRLTYNGSENVSPDWGANGLIAFATRRGAPYQIAVIDPAKGEASTRLLTARNDTCEFPTWAPDGRHIAYSRTQGKTASVFVIDSLEGSTDQPWVVASGQGEWVFPAWSPRKK